MQVSERGGGEKKEKKKEVALQFCSLLGRGKKKKRRGKGGKARTREVIILNQV